MMQDKNTKHQDQTFGEEEEQNDTRKEDKRIRTTEGPQ